jgi:hypothetical protein
MTFTVGVYVAVMTMIHAPVHQREVSFPLRGAVYVGGNACFTCHEDQNSDWSLVLNTQPAAAPMANPAVAMADVSVPVAESRADTGATTAEIPAARDMLNQPYVIATEDDHVSFSGGHEMTPTDPLEQGVTCGDCHAALIMNLRFKLA